LEVSSSRIDLADLEKIATLLDLRTITLVKKPDQLPYVVQLKELYVAYATTANKVSEREPEEEVAGVVSATRTDAVRMTETLRNARSSDEEEEVVVLQVLVRVDYVDLYCAEFDIVWRSYLKRMTSLEWSNIFLELEFQTWYNFFDLIDADLGRVLGSSRMRTRTPRSTVSSRTWPRICKALSRLAPRFELRRAHQLSSEPHSDEGQHPPH
jgi:hypothetical protein